jgi:hypothetical protein
MGLEMNGKPPTSSGPKKAATSASTKEATKGLEAAWRTAAQTKGQHRRRLLRPVGKRRRRRRQFG